MHLDSLCQTRLTLMTHTVSETENRTSCLTTLVRQSQSVAVSQTSAISVDKDTMHYRHGRKEQPAACRAQREGGWHDAMVGFSACSWRRQLADRHLPLPFPSLSLNEGPPSRCFGPPFLFFHRWRVASTETLRLHTAFLLREGTSEAAPEALGQAVGGGCESVWGRLLSVTNAIEAGTWRQGDSGWAKAGRPGGGYLPLGGGEGGRGQGVQTVRSPPATQASAYPTARHWVLDTIHTRSGQ